MTDDEELIARLRDWPYQGETMAGEAADRIEALTEQLAAARDDTKEAEAYAEELEKELRTTRMAQAVMDNTVADLEGKLAKAVEALDTLVRDCEADYPPSHGAIKHFAIATLAEIKGESHD